MGELSGRSIDVAGAGVFGLVAAWRLARAGARVRLYDPAPLGDSASGVAAGMLAPAFEAAFDPELAPRFPLLVASRDLWPGILSEVGAAHVLERCGAVYVPTSEQEAVRVRDGVAALGGIMQTLGSAEVAERQPGLAPAPLGAIYTPDDWRLDPRLALGALAAAFEAAGGRRIAAPVELDQAGRATAGGSALRSDALIVAAGADSPSLARLAPELGALRPIKGQIVHFQGGPRDGPIVRTAKGYVTPHQGGAIAGATMEAGRGDREVEPAVVAGLVGAAAALFPALATAPWRGLAGVRSAAPDGLPLAGPSSDRAEVILAVAARRNGWLLAPLVAEIVLAALAGRPDPTGGAFAPARLG